MPAHPPAGHLEPAQCPSRPPCSPSTRLGTSKDHEVAASVHADTPNPGEPVTTEQQPHTPLPWTQPGASSVRLANKPVGVAWHLLFRARPPGDLAPELRHRCGVRAVKCHIQDRTAHRILYLQGYRFVPVRLAQP